ncbi:MAG: hypothetical protein FJ264_16600 [Planctomycetes bacterium]|nr:hypothetical protein [Planctomycetota bacterium]
MRKRFSAIITLSITIVTFSFLTFDSIVLAKKDTAQWKKSGSDIYYIKGNVGIGTSTPSNRLEVESDINPQILVSGETGFVVIPESCTK